MVNFLALLLDLFGIFTTLRNLFVVYNGGQQPIDVSNIHYLFYNEQGVMNYSSNSNSDNIIVNTNCKAGGIINIIVPGWTEKCSSQGWVQQLVKNLNDPTINPNGGCTCCVDYSTYSVVADFPTLFSYYEALSRALADKLIAFKLQSLSFERMKIISFSFGAVMAVKSGCLVGSDRIGSIDVTCCPYNHHTAIDAANPTQPQGQNLYPTDFRKCAKHVQGIHCSVNFGTNVHDQCHEDWVMGNCGISQASATNPPFGSHGQCPYIYVYGMTGRFKSVAQPIGGPCTLENSASLNTTAYGVQRMGFKMPQDYGFKTFFADTYACPPFYDPEITNCNSTVPPFANL